MRKVKYAYKGMTLQDYCKKTGLNYTKIVYRISYLKEDPKYKDLPMEQVIEHAIEHIDSKRSKYMYKDMTLKEYCEMNNLKFANFMHKIESAKSNPIYKDLSLEKIIDLIANDKLEKKMKYQYGGMSLKEYCKKNNLDYDQMMRKIPIVKKDERYKHLSINEIVALVVEDKVERNYPYTRLYKGEPLLKYCQKHNLSLSTILYRISAIKEDERYKRLTEDEIIYIAVNDLYSKVSKYHYKGMNLPAYCEKIGLKYSIVISRIRRFKEIEKYKSYSDEKLIEMATSPDYQRLYYYKYMYKGLAITKYCSINHMSPRKVIDAIEQTQNDEKYQGLEIEEIIEIAMNNLEDKRLRYTLDGMSLRKYCDLHNIRYDTVRYRIRYLRGKETYKDVSDGELINIAIKDVIDLMKREKNFPSKNKR